MALIHEFAAAETSPANFAKTVINTAARSAFVADLGRQFWLWYAEHQDDVILTVLGVYRVRLRRLRALFIRIFGLPPVEA
jgi:hypothetical protein